MSQKKMWLLKFTNKQNDCNVLKPRKNILGFMDIPIQKTLTIKGIKKC